MPPSRRVISNGRSPLVRKQSQITTFFSPGRTPNPSPNPKPSPSKEGKKKSPLAIPSPFSDSNTKTPSTYSNPKSRSTAKTKTYAGEVIGRKIRVFWLLDKTWYEGNVKSFDKLTGKHLVQYEDAEEEVLDLGKEKIEFVEEEAPRKLQRLRRMPTMEEDEEDEGDGSGDDDSDDEDWGKGMEKNAEDDDSEDVELEENEEEEVVAKRPRSGSGRSSNVGSGKRKKVDVEKLACCKKFRFEGDGDGLGEKGCSPVTPASKSKSCVRSTTENGQQFDSFGSNLTGDAAERFGKREAEKFRFLGKTNHFGRLNLPFKLGSY